MSPDASHTYRASNTIDRNLRTSWADGVGGNGEGQSLHYDFTKAHAPIDIQRIGFVNGYADPDKPYLFRQNARIKDIEIIPSSGESVTVTLQDTPAWQTVSQNFKGVTQITLKTRTVYPGSKYRDLALTEARFTVSHDPEFEGICAPDVSGPLPQETWDASDADAVDRYVRNFIGTLVGDTNSSYDIECDWPEVNDYGSHMQVVDFDVAEGDTYDCVYSSDSMHGVLRVTIDNPAIHPDDLEIEAVSQAVSFKIVTKKNGCGPPCS